MAARVTRGSGLHFLNLSGTAVLIEPYKACFLIKNDGPPPALSTDHDSGRLGRNDDAQVEGMGCVLVAALAEASSRKVNVVGAGQSVAWILATTCREV